MTSVPRIDRPEPGFFQTRLVKGGPLVPARIWVDDTVPDRPAVLLAEVNGRPSDAWRIWPSVAGNNITEAEFHHLSRVVQWAETSVPHAPEANPREPINLATQPAFMPRRTA